MNMELYLFPLLFHFIIILSCTCFLFLNPVQPLCHGDEHIALLQLKEILTVNMSASREPTAYPKLASWKAEQDGTESNCCSWDGVKCDDKTGHVISLDLSSSFLYGSINSNTSIFKLKHLQMLNLADNHFNYSRVPPELSCLSKLTYLNLSSSFFIGLPSEISLLSNLSTIDLSYVNISSEVPDFLVNLSSLTYLLMRNCGLYGEFPEEIFHLPKIQFLAAQHNPNLTGQFPKFRSGSPLRKLWFSHTNFCGTIPFSIGKLESLEILSVARAKFSGFLPSSLSSLTNITYLDLSYNNFVGEVPPFLQNLTKLNILWLGGNQLIGQIPFWIGNLTELSVLSLARNKLSGPVPQSLSRLKKLRTLNLFENNLTGTLNFEHMFRDMKYLAELRIDANNLWIITRVEDINGTFGKLEILGLNSCNLSHFPGFLRYQDKLRYLDLGKNNIHGKIPKWIWNTNIETMAYLALNDNFLSGLDHGKSEDNSQLFCNLNSLQLLDLSNNLLSGMTLPKCLENPNNLLSVLNIKNNSFHGTIPQMCSNNGSLLKMIDLSYNQLNGQIPRSLSNCQMLESLNLGNNQILDVFPSWLGELPRLRLLTLRSNNLHGEVANPTSNSQFPNLRVIDVSHNNFTGKLPSQYFQHWNAMKVVDSSNSYLKTESSFEAVKRTWYLEYTYSTIITIKGIEVRYGKIQEVLVIIDFSSNMFQGEIPDSIGSLLALRVLNLSNNVLSGNIPSSLGNIRQVESLDLSQNQLSGEIPQEFVGLTFLAFFNISYNHLTGRVPRGNQLNTFENSSYIGNLGLCGDPLSKKCGDTSSSTEPTSSFGEEDEESESLFGEFNWMTVALGFSSGIVVGVIVENKVMGKKRELWLRKTFWRKKRCEGGMRHRT